MLKQEIDKANLIAFRDVNASDVPFIMATWLRGLRFGNSWYKLIDNEIYYSFYHKVIEAVLLNPLTQVKIACLKEDPEVILGYCVYQGNKLHWMHVKKAWRNIGIAKSLVPKGITTITHLTEIGKAIFNKNKDLIFNPFMLV